MNQTKNSVVIFYHDHCPDGFGAAYAAWKKFGDTAEYIPLSYGDIIPFEKVTAAELYLLDLCFEKPIMDQLASNAAKLTVLDHHKGVEDVVRSMPNYVFDVNRSGASIAWNFFHPDTALPSLMAHLEDGDLYRFALPDTRPLFTYLESKPYNFSWWDELVEKLDTPAARESILTVARAYNEYFERLAEISAERAKLVHFEEMEIYFGYTHPLRSMKSLVGNLLAKKKGPCSLVVTALPEGYGVSIRGDGSIDVAAIARKYGGNGHPNAAGFAIPREGPFPWKLIEKMQ